MNRRSPSTSICAALLCLLAGAPARAEDAAAAGKRIAASLLKQLDGLVPAPQPPVKTLVVKAFGETGAAKGSGQGKALADAISAALAAGGRLQLRDAEAVERVGKEAAIKGGIPAVPVQAFVTGEVLGGDAGAPYKAAVRVVSASTGERLAEESATLGGSAAPSTAPAGSVTAAAPRPRNATESRSVDVAMRKIADQLVAGLQKSGNARYQRLAVLAFAENGAEAKKRELGAVVGAELSTSLRRDHGMLLVERQKLQQVMGEIKLGQSGAVDAASAPEIGKLADAQALVLGSVSEAGDRYLIEARVVATETAETLAAASESVPAANLVALSSDAVVLRSKKDAVFRSLIIPGWGQIYNREPVKGYVFEGAIVASLGAGLAFHFLGASAERQYKDNTSRDQLCALLGKAGCSEQEAAAEAESLRSKAESRFTTRNVALIVAGSLWLLNVVDAYVSGVDGDKLLGGPTAVLLPSGDGGVGAAVAWSRRF